MHYIPQLGLTKEIIDSEIYLCPYVPLIPCLAVLTTFALCAGIPPKIWVYFLAFELIGVVFYFFYGIKHSVVNANYREAEMQSSKSAPIAGAEIELS